MENRSFEYCRCLCHKYPDSTYKHLKPCCQYCRYCDSLIQVDYYMSHRRECIARYWAKVEQESKQPTEDPDDH